jgi:hypothetical protein
MQGTLGGLISGIPPPFNFGAIGDFLVPENFRNYTFGHGLDIPPCAIQSHPLIGLFVIRNPGRWIRAGPGQLFNLLFRPAQ